MKNMEIFPPAFDVLIPINEMFVDMHGASFRRESIRYFKVDGISHKSFENTQKSYLYCHM